MSRPRSSQSSLYLADRWGIPEHSARLLNRNLSDDAMAILVNEIKRDIAKRAGTEKPRGKYSGGMAALGMQSMVPGIVRRKVMA